MIPLDITGMDSNDARYWVCVAETTKFTPEDLILARVQLRAYIDKFIHAADDDTHVALGSAIRKYIATQSWDGFDDVGKWLEVGQTGTTEPVIEQELTKMIYRSLLVKPLDIALPTIQNNLRDIVKSYSSDRVLLKRYYGGTFMNAILSLAMMNDNQIEVICQLVSNIRTWLKDAIRLRCKSTMKTMGYQHRCLIMLANATI